MLAYQVNDMSCGHCVATITNAVRAVDAGAAVQIDLATHRVTIDAPTGRAAEFGDAIRAAGYTPEALGTSDDPSGQVVDEAGGRRA